MQRSLNDQEVGKLVVQVNASGIFGQGVVRIWKKLKVLPSGNYSRFSEKEKDSNQVIILNYHRNGTVNDYHQSVIQYLLGGFFYFLSDLKRFSRVWR